MKGRKKQINEWAEDRVAREMAEALRKMGHSVETEESDWSSGQLAKIKVNGGQTVAVIEDTDLNIRILKSGSRETVEDIKRASEQIPSGQEQRIRVKEGTTMKEQKLRKIIREEILQEYGTDADTGRATTASEGGPGTEWFYMARMISDLARNRREVQDIGRKEVGGETVHEFAVQNEVFQIRKVR